MGVTVAWYATNPISMLILLSVMLLGAFYLLSYRGPFSTAPS